MTTTDALRKAAEVATPGPWTARTLGGASTVLAPTEPPRNDTRAAAFGYRPENGHCIAHAFLDDDNRPRMDFVCFAHRDAAFIAAADPQTILALLRVVETAKAHRAACKAILATEKTAELMRAMKAMADTRDALDAALAALEATNAT